MSARRVSLVLLLVAGAARGDDPLAAAHRAEAAGDFATAEREYRKSLAFHEDAEVLQRLGLVRHLQNKFREAIPALQKAVRLQPDLWGAHLFLGIDYYRTNEFAKALQALERAAQLQPRQADIRFWRGATLIALKRYLKGQEVLEELLREKSDNLEVLRILAQSYSDYAVQLHNQVAAAHPQSAWAHRVHGQALESEGLFDAALKEYRQAEELNPGMEGLQDAIRRTAAGRR